MIRVFIYIFVVCVLGAAFGWVISHNSVVTITFMHTRLSISLLAFFSIFIVFLGILWGLLYVVCFAPGAFYNYFYTRRQRRGREALSQGLLAAFIGDHLTAQKMETRALKYLEENCEPLIKLLQAQTLVLQKDSVRAIHLYEEMRQKKSTKLAGLYGLFCEAMNTKTYEAAQHYAQEAFTLSPSLVWAHQAVLDRLSAEGQWDEALDVFEKVQKALPRSARLTAEHNHTHALLLSGKALHVFKIHPVKARSAILKAHKLVPDFGPITVITAGILYKLNETRKADKIIIEAWKKDPHPDFGALYLGREERAVGHLKKAKKLASYNKNTFESAFLIAKAALDAGELTLAREQAKKALNYHPRESVYLLLANIEEVQGNDQGLVHKWLSLARNAERDPTWICDNTLFSSWSAVSPISGRLGCFEWKAPPRRFPLTLEADDIVLKKEDKQNVAEIAFKDNLLSKCPPKENDSPFEVYTNKQDEKTLNQVYLDVDDSNIKTTKKEVSTSKKKFQLF
ncbi:heme biosynthesis protein HemY [Bartonella melophagi]|uniref:HemY N-terminal domain-containing protein n=1 Tax=Bartonella melophagi K-2C TaxID=1094557 RepID=J0R8H1_9HYPH|nr:heme biosynthesis HemY N-terminal domain-containing protein [Bartonella melophagi]EJF92034.1 hypothetical protein ME3_00257 [Bartonella melophagi K-2C]